MNKIVTKTIDINNPPKLTQEQLEHLTKLEQVDDSEIDFSDIATLTDEFWINAVQNPFF